MDDDDDRRNWELVFLLRSTPITSGYCVPLLICLFIHNAVFNFLLFLRQLHDATIYYTYLVFSGWIDSSWSFDDNHKSSRLIREMLGSIRLFGRGGRLDNWKIGKFRGYALGAAEQV